MVLFRTPDNKYAEIEAHGIPYGNSIFTKYDNHIYALVPSAGYYILDKVDVDSFKPLSSKQYYDRHIGMDKNHVYFGNIPTADLNPDKLYAIGNGYYSDGMITYFCSYPSENNTSLNAITEILEQLAYSLFNGKKPQSYISL